MKKYIIFITLLIASGVAQGQRPKIRPYNSVITKDAVAHSGLFTVYAVRDSIFFEIPDSIFKRRIMVIPQMVKTPALDKNAPPPIIPPVGPLANKFPGEVLTSEVIFFDSGPGQVINILHDIAAVDARPGSSVANAVDEFRDKLIAQTFPIIAVSESHHSFVVDATGFLNNGNDIFGTTGSLSLHVDYIRAYPENVEFGIDEVEGAPGQDGHVFEKNFSLIALPRIPMLGRIQDRRIGFFPAGEHNLDYFSDDQQKVEKRQVIARWNLQPKPEDIKKYQRGELVEPIKPIILYIDPNTPKKWVKYLIAGVNDWQAAFEQAGFKNAIVAREWPNGRDADLHDARFSFICYLPSTTANAYGPHVADPRTGEIINTHIGWYHNVMTILNGWYKTQAGAIDPAARKLHFDDELMGQLIRFVSSHEIGHTLGLYHNHGASSMTPVEKLRDKEYLKINGHTVSIMDYARFDYAAQPEDSIPQQYLWPRIGEYDRWAIQWGYRYTGASSIEEDNTIMSRLATDSLSHNPRLWFGNEETEVFPQFGMLPNDPRVQTETLGDNNMVANSYGIKNFKRVVANLENWCHVDNGQYEETTEVYGWLQIQFKKFMTHAVAYIGGKERTYKSEETPGDVFAPTAKYLQKQALAFLNEQLFITPNWLVNNDVIDQTVSPNKKDMVAGLQTNVLQQLQGVTMFNRLNDNVVQFGSDKAYPLEEYFNDLHQYIWAGLSAHRPIDQHLRNLQMSYIDDLSLVLVSKNPNCKETEYWSLVRRDLLQLENEIAIAIPGYADGPEREHLQAVAIRLKKIFKSA